MRHKLLRLLTFVLLLPILPIMGAIKVKSVTEVRDKWLDVTPGRATYYEKEAAVAGADWEKGAAEAGRARTADSQRALAARAFHCARGPGGTAARARAGLHHGPHHDSLQRHA